jgi:hypothetical protein
MTDLIEVIDGLINGRVTQVALPRGLRFQFKAGGTYGENNRLLVYRLGAAPSAREFGIVRRQLEMLLPDVDLGLSDEFEYMGRDGRARRCRTFSWQPAAAQGRLLDAPPARYTEAE